MRSATLTTTQLCNGPLDRQNIRDPGSAARSYVSAKRLSTFRKDILDDPKQGWGKYDRFRKNPRFEFRMRYARGHKEEGHYSEEEADEFLRTPESMDDTYSAGTEESRRDLMTAILNVFVNIKKATKDVEDFWQSIARESDDTQQGLRTTERMLCDKTAIRLRSIRENIGRQAEIIAAGSGEIFEAASIRRGTETARR